MQPCIWTPSSERSIVSAPFHTVYRSYTSGQLEHHGNEDARTYHHHHHHQQQQPSQGSFIHPPASQAWPIHSPNLPSAPPVQPNAQHFAAFSKNQDGTLNKNQIHNGTTQQYNYNSMPNVNGNSGTHRIPETSPQQTNQQVHSRPSYLAHMLPLQFRSPAGQRYLGLVVGQVPRSSGNTQETRNQSGPITPHLQNSVYTPANHTGSTHRPAFVQTPPLMNQSFLQKFTQRINSSETSRLALSHNTTQSAWLFRRTIHHQRTSSVAASVVNPKSNDQGVARGVPTNLEPWAGSLHRVAKKPEVGIRKEREQIQTSLPGSTDNEVTRLAANVADRSRGKENERRRQIKATNQSCPSSGSQIQRLNGQEKKNTKVDEHCANPMNNLEIILPRPNLLRQACKAVAIVPPISKRASNPERNDVTNMEKSLRFVADAKQNSNDDPGTPSKTSPKSPTEIQSNDPTDPSSNPPQDPIGTPQIPTASQEPHSDESVSKSPEDESVSEDTTDLPDADVRDVTLKELFDLIESLQVSSAERCENDVGKTILDLFWDGDHTLLVKQLDDVLAGDLLKTLLQCSATDEHTVVFQHLESDGLNKLPGRYRVLGEETASPGEEFTSSWLNVNGELAEIEGAPVDPGPDCRKLYSGDPQSLLNGTVTHNARLDITMSSRMDKGEVGNVTDGPSGPLGEEPENNRPELQDETSETQPKMELHAEPSPSRRRSDRPASNEPDCPDVTPSLKITPLSFDETKAILSEIYNLQREPPQLYPEETVKAVTCESQAPGQKFSCPHAISKGQFCPRCLENTTLVNLDFGNLSSSSESDESESRLGHSNESLESPGVSPGSETRVLADDGSSGSKVCTNTINKIQSPTPPTDMIPENAMVADHGTQRPKDPDLPNSEKPCEKSPPVVSPKGISLKIKIPRKLPRSQSSSPGKPRSRKRSRFSRMEAVSEDVLFTPDVIIKKFASRKQCPPDGGTSTFRGQRWKNPLMRLGEPKSSQSEPPSRPPQAPDRSGNENGVPSCNPKKRDSLNQWDTNTKDSLVLKPNPQNVASQEFGLALFGSRRNPRVESFQHYCHHHKRYSTAPRYIEVSVGPSSDAPTAEKKVCKRRSRWVHAEPRTSSEKHHRRSEHGLKIRIKRLKRHREDRISGRAEPFKDPKRRLITEPVPKRLERSKHEVL